MKKSISMPGAVLTALLLLAFQGSAQGRSGCPASVSADRVVSGARSSAARSGVRAPLHRWTFDDGTARDVVGGANGTLQGGARIAKGRLVVGQGSFMKTSALPETIGAKTLVVWVSLATLTQGGGSALTIENSTADNAANYFDAIVFAERTPGQWMAGSDFYHRTPADNRGAKEATAGRLVMVAIAYGPGNKIGIYRNGAPYATVATGTAQTYRAGGSDVLIGLRHTTCGANCNLRATIDEARIYGSTLTAAQIATLYRTRG